MFKEVPVALRERAGKYTATGWKPNYEFEVPKALGGPHTVELSSRQARASEKTPVRVWTSPTHRCFWLWKRRVYVTSDMDLTPADVLALFNEAANQRRLRLQKAHALQAMTEENDKPAKRPAIPQAVKVSVWQRDAGRCVDCGSNKELEFDHIIPLAMGGANTMRNLQLLCSTCNRRKGASLG